MTNKEMMRQLYERMAAEQQKYKAWLLEQPPNVILDNTMFTWPLEPTNFFVSTMAGWKNTCCHSKQLIDSYRLLHSGWRYGGSLFALLFLSPYTACIFFSICAWLFICRQSLYAQIEQKWLVSYYDTNHFTWIKRKTVSLRQGRIMSIFWTEEGFNMNPPEQPTLSEIKPEKEQAGSRNSCFYACGGGQIQHHNWLKRTPIGRLPGGCSLYNTDAVALLWHFFRTFAGEFQCSFWYATDKVETQPKILQKGA